MNISIITSVPMTPPWDQGDKNLAYALTGALPQHRFRVLTTCKGPAPLGANLDLEPVYRTKRPNLLEKAQVYWRLLTRPHSLASTLQPSDGCIGRTASSASDLYHLVYRPYALSAWLLRQLPEFQRRPTLHTLPAAAGGRPLTSNLFFADRIVVLSEYARHMLRRSGVNNVVHIPPGIEVERWAGLRHHTDCFKTRLGLAHHPVILFPGHYAPGQGADVMLRALPAIAARVPDVQVIFACRTRSWRDRGREHVAHRIVQRAGLTENVRFYNTVADMETLIGASDLVALPLETMRDKVDIPTTCLEALAAGRPIVISDLQPMSELVTGLDSHTRNDVGLTVSVGNSSALAQAIVDLLSDRAMRERMGHLGQALVRDCFDIRQAAHQYHQLYREMAA